MIKTYPQLTMNRNPEVSGETSFSVSYFPVYPSQDDIAKVLSSIPSNYKVLVDPETDRKFETVTYNKDATEHEMIELASLTSSASNVGNLYETTVLASLMRDTRIIYVGSPAKGKTSQLSQKEKRHIATTGSWIADGDKPIEYIQSMYRALKNSGIMPNRIVGNSSGGAIGTALAAALEDSTLENLVLIDRPNFISIGKLSLGKGMFYDEFKKRKIHKLKSNDPHMITNDLLERARNIIGEDTLDGFGDELGLGIVYRQKFGSEASAYAKGHKDGSPALRDIESMHLKHPDAVLGLIQPEDSLFAGAYTNIGSYITNLLVQRMPELNVNAITVGDGASHTSKEAYPTLFATLVRQLMAYSPSK